VDKCNVTILCGDAQGADLLGFRYASQHGMNVEHYPADWSKYGNSAGPIRNRKMAERADALIAFWDGKSSGTRDMIECAKKSNIPYTIINI
jgi:hypothetical protein